MAVFGVGRGKARDKQAVPGPAVLAPRRSLDGWTLEGTPLAFRFAREELRELATLMHGVSAGMETPYTYDRASDLLEKGGERPQALAVLDAYFMLPAHIRDANQSETRTLGRRRHRLRKRLGTPPPNASAPDPVTAVGPAEAQPALESAPIATPAPPPAPAPATQFTRGILSPEPETAAKPELPAAAALPVPPRPTVPPPMPASEPSASEPPTSEPESAPPPPPAAPPAPTEPPPVPPRPPADPVIPPRPTRSATPTAPPEGRR
ncbi:hypothetical protein OG216_29450 [Streptomycetaceae bacterium NBC_01309]